MHYANRARNIHNAPTKNVDATAAELQRLNALTRILQCELIKSRFQGSGAGEETMGHIDDELMEQRDLHLANPPKSQRNLRLWEIFAVIEGNVRLWEIFADFEYST